MARQRKPTNLWKTLERYQDAIVAEPEACKGKWAETFLLGAREVRLDPVSYTHLTLPTSARV